MKLPTTKPSPLAKRTTVLLVDDNALVREGFRTILELEDDLEVVGEGRDGRQAVALARKLHPAVVLMDVTMPVLNGLEALRQMLKILPATLVLMLSCHNDEAYVQAAMEAGAAGYLLKQTAANEVCQAIREVQKGEKVFSPAIARRFADSMAWRRAGAGFRAHPASV